MLFIKRACFGDIGIAPYNRKDRIRQMLKNALRCIKENVVSFKRRDWSYDAKPDLIRTFGYVRGRQCGCMKTAQVHDIADNTYRDRRRDVFTELCRHVL